MSPDEAGQDRPRWVFREEQTTGYAPGAVALTHAALCDAVGLPDPGWGSPTPILDAILRRSRGESPAPGDAEALAALDERERRTAEARREYGLAEMADIEAIGRRFGETVTRCEDMTLRMVARFHGPDGGRTPDCEGCGAGEYSLGDDWPCPTFRMIEAAVNPERVEAADYDGIAPAEPTVAPTVEPGDEPGPDAHHGG